MIMMIKMQSYVPACTTSSVLPFVEQEGSLVNFSPDVLAHCYKKFESYRFNGALSFTCIKYFSVCILAFKKENIAWV
jgi:hypothetical protein